MGPWDKSFRHWEPWYARTAGDVLGLFGPKCFVECELKAKVQLDIDGTANAWSGLFWKLLSNSAVAKLASPHQCTQWYYTKLEAGKHFIDVPNVNALPGLVKQALSDDAALHRIAKDGTAFAASITYESAQKFSIGILRRIFV